MSIPNPFRPVCGKPGGELPPGYVRLEYLESTGTQYIDTVQLADESTKWEAVIENTTRNAYEALGAYDSSITQVFSLSYSNAGARGYLCQWWDNKTLRPGYDVTGPVTLSLDNMQAIARIDELSTEMTGTRGTPIHGLFLFARNQDGAVCGHWRIWRSSIWKGGNLVQNLIPALDPDGKPCMFDTVSREPFYNAGTGEFLYA